MSDLIQSNYSVDASIHNFTNLAEHFTYLTKATEFAAHFVRVKAKSLKRLLADLGTGTH